MVILDVAIVNVALPSIRRDLGFSAVNLQWIVNAYTLTFAGFLLLGGGGGDDGGGGSLGAANDSAMVNIKASSNIILFGTIFIGCKSK